MLPALLIITLGFVGCKDKDDKPAADPGPTEACARPVAAEAPGAGDANGDGAVDLADPITVLRYKAAGGPAPACDAAVDLIAGGTVEMDDAFSLLLHLYEGLFQLPDVEGCDAPAAGGDEVCAPMVLGIEAPESGSGETFEATITLDSGGQSVEGWSLSVAAEGCTIVSATTNGTDGARVIDAPAGLRDLGYDATFLVEGGAVSTVVLGFMDPIALGSGPRPVLTVAGEGCGTCTLRVGGALEGLGQPVETLAVADGAAWPLAEVTAKIEVCGR